MPGTASAVVVEVVNDAFDSYATGDLVGQGGWTTTGTAVTTPIQVAGGADKHAAVGTSGQDAYKAFTATVNHDDGASITTTLNLNLTAAQAGGDYFFHLSNPLATTSNFYARLFAKTLDTGFVIGLVDTSGTGSTTTYGTAAVTLNADHAVGITWNFVPGATNDTFAVTVDGAPYLTHTWTSALAEPATLAAVNLRQGGSTAAPTAQVDDVVVTTTATVVPEPASAGALAALGAVGLLRRRRR